MHHYRTTMKHYKQRHKDDGCPFCLPETLAKATYSDEYVYIVPNLTSYDLWEGHDVRDHLLIIPRRHVHSLDELSDSEKLAVMQQAAVYEKQGYNVYSRGVGAVTRSVKHQHTHLIKTSSVRPRLALFLRRPYLLFKI